MSAQCSPYSPSRSNFQPNHRLTTSVKETNLRKERIAHRMPQIMQVIHQLEDDEKLIAIELAAKKMIELGYPVSISSKSSKNELKCELDKFADYIKTNQAKEFPESTRKEKISLIMKIALAILIIAIVLTSTSLLGWFV